MLGKKPRYSVITTDDISSISAQTLSFLCIKRFAFVLKNKLENISIGLTTSSLKLRSRPFVQLYSINVALAKLISPFWVQKKPRYTF